MLVTDAGITIEDKALQPLNADPPIVPNWLPSANVTVVSEHLENALFPMLVTDAGIVIEDKALHP